MISNAFAQAASGPASGGSGSLILLVAFVAIFWFLLIRPQQKRMRAHQDMVNALKVGDEIITGGGVLAKVADIKDNVAIVEMTKDVKVKIQKHTITAVVPKGSTEQAS
ncbi:MAG: preprotein translocase subunit YajC [Gammaproteobacteria bacterium]|nr:preprotein translocase subunit YajC [Gammaproteobacteria bacterium]